MTDNFAYLQQQQLPQTFNPKNLPKPGPSPHCHHRRNLRHAKNRNVTQQRHSQSPFRRSQNRHRQRHRSSSMRLRSLVRVVEVWVGYGYSLPSISLFNFKSPESNPLQGSRKSVPMQPAIRWFDWIFPEARKQEIWITGMFVSGIRSILVYYRLHRFVHYSVQGLNNGPILTPDRGAVILILEFLKHCIT